jgi:hypothetical protein
MISLSNEYFAVSKRYIVKIFGLSILLFCSIVWTGEEVRKFLHEAQPGNTSGHQAMLSLEVREAAPTGSAAHLEGWARFKPSIPHQIYSKIPTYTASP